MTRPIITPQLISDLLDTHAIAGVSYIEDISQERDNSEVTVRGTYDLWTIAKELNHLNDGNFGPDPVAKTAAAPSPAHRREMLNIITIACLSIIVLMLVAVIAMHR